ncbi:MAG: excinuclease ABC subunit UvrC [Candidatus Buchananbacteria bacterium]
MLSNKLKIIPNGPGCYLFKNKKGKIVYVGKAKNLRKRVSSYWQKKDHDPKTRALVRLVADFDFFLTNTEVEALIMEAKLIRDHQPPYNILLKEGQRYAYIKITEDKFPRLVSVREFKTTEKVFGPFVSGETRRQAIYLANTLFKLRVCKRLPKIACLLYHIKQCSAPCIGQISAVDYQTNVKKAESLLKGQTPELIRELRREMKIFSQQQNYESAKIRRDQILTLTNLAEKQRVSLPKGYNQDVINYQVIGPELVIQLFNVLHGLVSGRREYRLTATKELALEKFSEFIKQYYFQQEIPSEVIVPQMLIEQELIAEYLSQLAQKKVKIIVPEKGDKLALLELVKKNILISAQLGEPALLELQNALQLPRLPEVIECFDISQIQGTNAVGSMVNFKAGRPDKNNYRHFIIQTVTGQNDFAMMKEIIYRRYSRLLAEKKPLPDLLMVDGGRPQLSAALQVMRDLGLALPVVALAKREEELYTFGSQYPVKLNKKSPALKLVQRLRDEAHRFAISFHRLKRSQGMVK